MYMSDVRARTTTRRPLRHRTIRVPSGFGAGRARIAIASGQLR
jgi:hypothetical protein